MMILPNTACRRSVYHVQQVRRICLTETGHSVGLALAGVCAMCNSCQSPVAGTCAICNLCQSVIQFIPAQSANSHAIHNWVQGCLSCCAACAASNLDETLCVSALSHAPVPWASSCSVPEHPCYASSQCRCMTSVCITLSSCITSMRDAWSSIRSILRLFISPETCVCVRVCVCVCVCGLIVPRRAVLCTLKPQLGKVKLTQAMP